MTFNICLTINGASPSEGSSSISNLGRLIKARAIGVMTMIDSGASDDKIIAVATNDPEFSNYIEARDLPPHRLLVLKRFFQDYKVLENKQVVVEDFMGPSEATQVVREALEMYRQLRRGELSHRPKH